MQSNYVICVFILGLSDSISGLSSGVKYFSYVIGSCMFTLYCAIQFVFFWVLDSASVTIC